MFEDGVLGQTYCIGGDCEQRNIDVIESVCKLFEIQSADYIEYVKDRAGHDFRYAIDNTKMKEELDWEPKVSFDQGMKKTIEWYNERH